MIYVNLRQGLLGKLELLENRAESLCSLAAAAETARWKLKQQEDLAQYTKELQKQLVTQERNLSITLKAAIRKQEDMIKQQQIVAHKALLAQQAAEAKAAKEAQDNATKEAHDKAAKEAQDKAAKEAQDKAAKEAQEKVIATQSAQLPTQEVAPIDTKSPTTDAPQNEPKIAHAIEVEQPVSNSSQHVEPEPLPKQADEPLRPVAELKIVEEGKTDSPLQNSS